MHKSRPVNGPSRPRNPEKRLDDPTETLKNSPLIQHVTREISPSQLDACIAFYAILGFQPVPVPDGVAGRAVWLQDESSSHQQVHLMPRQDATPASGHFAIVCRDYGTIVTALGDAGHEVDPRREHWGSPRSYVRDPAGNLVELMAWPPGDSKNPGGLAEIRPEPRN